MDSHVRGLLKLKQFGFNPTNILDLGAHKGEWTKLIKSSVFPLASYTLIDPVARPELADMKDCEVMTCLLDKTEHEVTFFQNGGTGDSIFKEQTLHFKNCDGALQLTKTLDGLFPDKKFDLIKIDCQGAEINIFRGGEKLVKETSAIIMEIPFMGQFNVGVGNFLEHIAFMDSIGFIPFDVAELHHCRE